jgi:ascorbate-specific PTS system EIIC-type component UlaA
VRVALPVLRVILYLLMVLVGFCVVLFIGAGLAVTGDLGGSVSGWVTALLGLFLFAGLATIVVGFVLMYRLPRRRKMRNWAQHEGVQAPPA